MPEYSSTTITPADAVKVPAMNGSTSGNFQLDALRNFVLASKGQANGLASLGSDGKLTLSQLPDLADDVLVYGSYATFPATGTAGKIYIAADTNIIYRWDDSLDTPAYVILTIDLSAYETKAEASELKSAIQSNTARIENLEQEHGGLVITQYRGSNAVPTGKAKNALVENIVGKTRAWNQLCPSLASSNWQNLNNTTSSFADNKVSFTTSQAYGGVRTNLKIDALAGHKYYVRFLCNKNNTAVVVASNNGNLSIWPGSSTIITPVGSMYLWEGISKVSASEFNTSIYIWDIRNSGWDEIQVSDLQISDLTLMDMYDSNKTDAQNIADFRAVFSNFYYAHNTGSLVDTTVEGVESRGFNLWDEVWEVATMWGNTCMASKNMISVNPLTAYYLTNSTIVISAYGFILQEYDADGNMINQTRPFTNEFTTTAQTVGIKFGMFASYYGSVYNGDICINSSSSLNGTYKPYVAPSTLSFPSPVTLRSAGSGVNEVSDELDVESGVPTTRVGYVDLSTIQWSVYGDIYYVNDFSDAKYPASNNDVANLTSDKYTIVSDSNVSSTTNGMSLGTTGQLAVKTDSTPTGMLRYEKATPSTGTSIGTSNPMIPTEGDGTINTIQTQDVVIDNCLDVAYLAL